jgi:hypothetical protein
VLEPDYSHNPIAVARGRGGEAVSTS